MGEEEGEWEEEQGQDGEQKGSPFLHLALTSALRAVSDLIPGTFQLTRIVGTEQVTVNLITRWHQVPGTHELTARSSTWDRCDSVFPLQIEDCSCCSQVTMITSVEPKGPAP